MLRIGDFVLLGATEGRLAASLATWPCPASIQMSRVNLCLPLVFTFGARRQRDLLWCAAGLPFKQLLLTCR